MSLNFKAFFWLRRSASFLVPTSHFRAETPQLTFGTHSNSTEKDKHLVELNKRSGALCICHHQPQSLGQGQSEQDLVFTIAYLVMKLRLITSLRNDSLYAVMVLPLHISPRRISTLASSSLHSNSSATFTHIIIWEPLLSCPFSLLN